MRYLLLLTALLAAVATPVNRAEAQGPVPVLDSGMLAYLETIADTARVEHGRCVLIRWEGDKPRLDSLVIAPHRWQTALHLSWAWDHCPPGTWAIWHNHTVLSYEETLQSRCFLSKDDRKILLHPAAPPLMIISVARGVSCAYLKNGRRTQQLPLRRGSS